MVRIIEDSSKFETWESAILGVIVVKRFDRKGDLADEIVRSAKRFMITPQERRLNQELAVSAELDPFKNGMLIPVSLIGSEEDVEDIRANPNHITEADMKVLIANKSVAEFAEKLASINNSITLKRMEELARQADAPVKRVEAITARLTEVSPALYNEVTVVGSLSTGGEVGVAMSPPSNTKSPSERL